MPDYLLQDSFRGIREETGPFPQVGTSRFREKNVLPFFAIASAIVAFLLPLESPETRFLAAVIVVASLGPIRFDSGGAWLLCGMTCGVAGLAALYHSHMPTVIWPILVAPVLYASAALRHFVSFGRRISGLTAGVIVYSVAASLLALTAQARRSPSLLETPSEWLIFLLPIFVILAAYYLSRETNLARAHAMSFFGISKLLAPTPGEDSIWPELARYMRTRLNYESVFIIIPDQKYLERLGQPTGSPISDEKFTVVGASGIGADGTLGHSYAMSAGLSAQAVRDKECVICNDVDKARDYVRLPKSTTRSELVAPVFDLDRPDFLLALISVHSTRRNSFTNSRDVPPVRQFRDYIQMYLRSSRYILRFHSHLRDELQQSAKVTGYDELVEHLLGATQRLFRPDCMAFAQLGLGTGVPLSVKTLTNSSASLGRMLLRDDRHLSEHEPIARALREWQAVMISRKDAADDQWTAWMASNEIDQVAITPIGPPDQRLGLLVVGSVMGVDYEWQLLLKSLTDAYSSKLLAARYVEGLFLPFLRPRINLHRFLAEAGLSRGEVDRQLEAAARINPDLAAVLESLRGVVNRFYAADATKPPDFSIRSLDAALKDFFVSDLMKRYGHRNIQPRVDPLIENESASLKLIVFRFVTEAVFNAINHGKAGRVFVRIWRLRSEVIVVVRDNGEGFDPIAAEAGDEHDPGGIMGIANNLNKLCNAGVMNWHWTAKGKGTVLSIQIPVQFSEHAPTERLVRDGMDQLEVEEWPS